MQKIGVALAGGGIKSFSQIPVLKALKNEGMTPDYYAGVSMGSVVAALSALGYAPHTIMDKVLRIEKEMMESRVFLRPSKKILPWGSETIVGGYVDGEQLEMMLAREIGDVKLSEVKTPLVMGATDLKTGKVVAFVSHPDLFTADEDWLVETDITLAKAVRASCSFPMVIGAMIYKDYVLVDGGVVMNLPVPLLNGYGKMTTIAVSMNQESFSQVFDSFFQYGMNLMDIMLRNQFIYDVKHADLHINIPLESIWVFDVGKGSEVINLGRQKVIEVLPEIRKLKVKPKKLIKKIFKDA